MKLISHRGNLNGIIKERENDPYYILEAVKAGFEVEIDVWCTDKGFHLGHDGPQYWVDSSFLDKSNFLLHAKNSDALYSLLKLRAANVFWHQEDDFTLTNKGIIWTYPNKKLFKNSICVLPEKGHNGDLGICYGICSDFIESYKNK
jgi:hypothetical protein